MIYIYACKPVIFSADTLDGQNPAPISDNSSSSCLNMLKPSQLVQDFAQTTLYQIDPREAVPEVSKGKGYITRRKCAYRIVRDNLFC